MAKVNLHIYQSPFRFESKMLRTGRSLLELDLIDQIIVASVWEQGLQEEEIISKGFTVKRFKLFLDRFPKNSLTALFKYLEFSVKVFLYYRKHELSHVNSHSLFVLPLGLFLKRYGKAKEVIYDAHELETERNGLKGLARRFSKWLELKLITKVDYLIVVSPSIAKWYLETYNLTKVYVIRNILAIPEQSEPIFDFRSKFEIPQEACIFIYQGIISKGRGTDQLIGAFSKQDENHHLIFMGYGMEQKKVQDAAKRYSNIHFMPAVPPQQIRMYTSGADIGISLIENTCLSYYYCLPNKFFEYIQCSLPVIVSNFPDMENLINKYNCGWATEVSEVGLTELLSKISPIDRVEKKQGVLLAKEELSWELEKLKLLEIYA